MLVRALGFDQVDLLSSRWAASCAGDLQQNRSSFARSSSRVPDRPVVSASAGYSGRSAEHQGHTDFQDRGAVLPREPTAATAAEQFVKRLKKNGKGQSRQIRLQCAFRSPAQGHPWGCKAFGLDEHRPSGPDQTATARWLPAARWTLADRLPDATLRIRRRPRRDVQHHARFVDDALPVSRVVKRFRAISHAQTSWIRHPPHRFAVSAERTHGSITAPADESAARRIARLGAGCGTATQHRVVRQELRRTTAITDRNNVIVVASAPGRQKTPGGITTPNPTPIQIGSIAAR